MVGEGVKSDLEKLEAKTGRLHSPYDYDRAIEKADEQPEKLTEEDLAVIDHWGGARKAAWAREKLSSAQSDANARVAREHLQSPDGPKYQYRDPAQNERILREGYASNKAHYSNLRSLISYLIARDKLLHEPEALTETDKMILDFFGQYTAPRGRSGVRPPQAWIPAEKTAAAKGAGMLTKEDHKALAEVVVEAIHRTVDPLIARLAALEARPVTKDAGVWKSGVLYEPGDITTHAGSGWICRAAHHSTGTEPSHDCFRLFVKAGRDAPRGQR